MRSFTTDDGFTVRIFSTMYIDWGLEILAPSGESLYYNPHCISPECVGFYWEDDEGEPLPGGIDWSDEDWQEYLECEADFLIECFVTDDQFGEALNE